uniref:Uncharacterized protein n=1 Tax=Sphaerodactylus townsendi TaxID=933632 RepID=A0ACB8F9C7_9SAUR
MSFRVANSNGDQFTFRKWLLWKVGSVALYPIEVCPLPQTSPFSGSTPHPSGAKSSGISRSRADNPNIHPTSTFVKRCATRGEEELFYVNHCSSCHLLVDQRLLDLWASAEPTHVILDLLSVLWCTHLILLRAPARIIADFPNTVCFLSTS